MIYPGNDFLDALLDKQNREWCKRPANSVEFFVRTYPEIRNNAVILTPLITNEIRLRRNSGDVPRVEDYAESFPEIEAEIHYAVELAEILEEKEPPEYLVLECEKYQRKKLIGQGGFARVYLGFQFRMARYVALKFIDKRVLRTAENVTQFEEAVHKAAALQHTNIVPIHVAWDDGDFYVVVMDYVAGKPLDEYIKAQDGGMVTPKLAAEMLIKMAAAIQHANSRKPPVFHHDLKPANVLITEDREPLIIDFGFSAYFSASAGEGDKALAATASFAPPEHIQSPGRQPDARTDV
ncbi:MAG: serine/threonine-protein kinase, partial [Planctomycetota bacterium]